MAGTAEEAVRNYLVALKDPSALRDDEKVSSLQHQLKETEDEIQRLKLWQQLQDAQSPPIDRYEQAFIEHAKSWAETQGISASAFTNEGVPPSVLRKAGFAGVRGRGRRRRSGTRRTRVSADEVRAKIPSGEFTIKDLQQRSGASPAVVRRVVQEEVEAGNVADLGPAKDHSGPGRAPTLYAKK